MPASQTSNTLSLSATASWNRSADEIDSRRLPEGRAKRINAPALWRFRTPPALAKLLITLAAAALLTPTSTSAHGVEFLSARLTLLPHAEVLLEVTADYGSNPMLTGEPAARAALADPIRLRSKEDGTLIPLATLAIPTVSSHDNWAEFAPASYLPDDTSTEAHQLLTFAWRWHSSTPEVTFEMPKGKLHDVLLWTRDQTHPDAPPKWMLLLGGDRSKPIPLAWPPWWQRRSTVLASSVLVLLVLAYFVSRNFTLRQLTPQDRP